VSSLTAALRCPSSPPLIDSNELVLDDIRFFVLDEADRLIEDEENARDIMKMYNLIPRGVHPLQVRHQPVLLRCRPCSACVLMMARSCSA